MYCMEIINDKILTLATFYDVLTCLSMPIKIVTIMGLYIVYVYIYLFICNDLDANQDQEQLETTTTINN